MGGGDGDGGVAQRQAVTEASKQEARDALNRQFGIGAAATAPDRASFTRVGGGVVGNPNAGERQLALSGGEEVEANYGGRTGREYMWDDQQKQGYSVPQGWTNDPIFDEAGFTAAQADYDATKNAGSDRNTLYQTVRDSAYNAGKRGLDESRDEAARKTKFELFARGLNGGSEDINQNAMLGRTYTQGLMDLGAKADLAKANFRGNDEQTRLGLLQSIDAGMDQGSAASSAMEQMRVNAERAGAEAQGTALGDLFANTGLIYNKGQAAQGKAAGTEWWNQYSPTSGRKMAGNANGVVTNV